MGRASGRKLASSGGPPDQDPPSAALPSPWPLRGGRGIGCFPAAPPAHQATLQHAFDSDSMRGPACRARDTFGSGPCVALAFGVWLIP